jgi:hypothetical protein
MEAMPQVKTCQGSIRKQKFLPFPTFADFLKAAFALFCYS